MRERVLQVTVRLLQAIKNNNGKLLLSACIALLSLMLLHTFFGGVMLNITVLKIAQVLWFFAAAYLLYFVLKAYLAFKETSLLVGLVGFVIITFAYGAASMVILTNAYSLTVETLLNVVVTIGYALIAIASGWLK